MLYAQDETNYGSFLLKLMVDRALNGYEAKDNLIYRQKIIDIIFLQLDAVSLDKIYICFHMHHFHVLHQ